MMKSYLMNFINLFMIFSLMNLIIMMIPSYNKYIHPMSMGLLLLFMAMITAMNLSMLNNSSMLAYMMFLIIIGGLLIIFLYFTSFINNSKMMMKWKFIIYMPIKSLLIWYMLIMFFLNKNFIINFSKYNETKNIMIINKMNLLNLNFEMMFMYMNNKNFITIMSMIYLFLCLTFIVKMYINKKMSLRKIN